jgi:hypothetical protein
MTVMTIQSWSQMLKLLSMAMATTTATLSQMQIQMSMLTSMEKTTTMAMSTLTMTLTEMMMAKMNMMLMVKVLHPSQTFHTRQRHQRNNPNHRERQDDQMMSNCCRCNWLSPLPCLHHS